MPITVTGPARVRVLSSSNRPISDRTVPASQTLSFSASSSQRVFVEPLPAAVQPAPAPVAPTPVPAPQPAPAPTPAPVVQPPGPSPAIDYATLPTQLLGAVQIDEDFRRGLKTRAEGGLWRLTAHGGVQDDVVPGDGWRRRYQGATQCLWTDASMESAMNPFSVQADGLHIKTGLFTPEQKARWWPQAPEVQALPYWTGYLGTASDYAPPAVYAGGRWPAAWGPAPVRDESLPHWETRGSVYICIRKRAPDVRGSWSQDCLYGYLGYGAMPEIDIDEVWWDYEGWAFHRWNAGVEDESYRIGGKNEVAPGGSPLIPVKARMADYGLLWTPDNVLRFYRDGRLIGVRQPKAGDMLGSEPMYLVVANQAAAWSCGGLQPAEVTRNEVVVESVRAWGLR